MTKQQLRKIFLQKRLALTDQEYSSYNAQICDLFFSLIDLSSVKVLHTFLPILKNKEPNTWLIIERLKKDFPHIKIAIPRANDDNTLSSYYLNDDCVLEENKWGIAEPTNGTLTNPKDIDLVIVPLLVFDKKGNRVGYGKGFYDRFLKTCREDCIKAGVSFFEAVETIEDYDEHDVYLTDCITPSQYSNFSLVKSKGLS
jgi:5-formyltetrahydrofolate cyclo-ligase